MSIHVKRSRVFTPVDINKLGLVKYAYIIMFLNVYRAYMYVVYVYFGLSSRYVNFTKYNQ